MKFFGIFGIGVISGIVFDLVVQWAFRLFFGKSLKRNNAYHLFLDINAFIPVLAGLVTLLVWGSLITIKIFFISAFLGTFLEYCTGRFLASMHGKPIWEYQYLPIGKYTSWISLLYWGGAGLLFVRLSSFIK